MWHRHAENRKPSFQAAHFEIFDTEEKVREWVEMNYQTRVQDDVIANIDPDWYRKPGEARSEYLERMRTVRENLVAVRALEHEEVAADGN